MKEGDKVIINKKVFIYESFYDRLESTDNTSPTIACPKCHNTTFSISYGSYTCTAHCKCGHSMTIYDG